MKHNQFILIPLAIVALIALCVGTVFASAYLIPGQYTEKFVPADEIAIASPVTGNELELKLTKVSGDTRDALLQYKDGDGNVYAVKNGKLLGGLIFTADDASAEKAITLDKAEKIALDFLSDRSDLNKYTAKEGFLNNSGHYQFDFERRAGEFALGSGYQVCVAKNGNIYSFDYPSAAAENFDDSLVEGVTLDKVRAYAEEKAGDGFVFDGCIIQQSRGKYVINCNLVKDAATPNETSVRIDYPLE